MYCCSWPSALCNSALGNPQHLGGDSFDCCTDRYEIVVYLEPQYAHDYIMCYPEQKIVYVACTLTENISLLKITLFKHFL